MIALVCFLIVGASSPQEVFDAYEKGLYRQAQEGFEALLQDSRFPNGPLYFNLGNVAFQRGDYARAVLNYRKARLQMPRDPEVDFNLRLSERRLGIEAEEETSFLRATGASLADLRLGELLVLSSLLQGLGFAGWIWCRRSSGMVRASWIAIVVLGFVCVGRGAQLHWGDPRPTGVVLGDGAAVREEPHRAFPPLLQLDPGVPLQVVERSDRWAYVVHSEGEGWTELGAIGIVEGARD